MLIAFKVDIDTRKGLQKGVPNLLRIFKDTGIHASFFVPMGPDRTGMTVTRIFRNPGIIGKARRTKALSVYGFPTLLYGTILPGPSIVKGNERILSEIVEERHEIGLHAYDHFKWQDYLSAMSRRTLSGEIKKALRISHDLLGFKPGGFASPGWQYNEVSCQLLEEEGFLYTSNTRGENVYFPVFGSRVSSLLEIPTTLPTLDELYLPIGGASIRATIDDFLRRMSLSDINVFTLHAEIEGAVCQDFIAEFIMALKGKGFSFVTLRDIAEDAAFRHNRMNRSFVREKTVPGRAGTLSCQVDYGAIDR